MEGSFNSHQVPLPKAKKDKEELQALQEWLSGYKPHELFKESGDVIDEVKSIIPPDDEKKLGQRKEAYRVYYPPDMPNWMDLGVKKGTLESSMKIAGKLLDQVFVKNPHTVRLFSPDELESNKLETSLEHTYRNFQWDQYSKAKDGRVIEVLSEHMCQGFMQGYTLTGRVAVFPSYESFLGIVHTMMVQYSKFNKMVRFYLFFGPALYNIVPTIDHHRQEKRTGITTSQASTTSKPAPGLDRSTTGSLTRTHPSSAPSSNSSPPPLESTFPRTPTPSSRRLLTASNPKTTST